MELSKWRKSSNTVRLGVSRRKSSENSRATKLDEKEMIKRLTHRLSFHATVPKFHSAVGVKQSVTWFNALTHFVESVSFNSFIIFVVLVDFVFFFLESYDDTYEAIGKTTVVMVSIIVAVVFIIEMALKLYVYSFSGFFHSTWNTVDFIIVVVTVVSVIFMLMTDDDDDNEDDDGLLGSLSDFSSGAKVIRLVRVVRLFRVYHIMTQIRKQNSLFDHKQGELRLPVLVCLDILARGVDVLVQPGVSQFVDGMVTVEDVNWVMSVMQSEQLYFPAVHLDDTLPSEVKELLSGGSASSSAPSAFGLHQHVGDPPDLAAAFGLPATPQLLEAISNLYAWDVDVWALGDLTRDQPLATVAYFFLHTLGLVNKFNLDSGVVKTTLERVEETYRSRGNPYHSHYKAALLVANVSFFLETCQVSDLITPLESLALLLAAVFCDLDHPGLTNSFLRSTNHEISLRFNDSSPLENHHIMHAFEILSQPEHAMLASLPPADFTALKDLIIDLILATDMTEHYTLLSRFSSKLIGKDPALNLQSPADRLLTLKALIHAADVAMPTKPLTQFHSLHASYMNELFLQGDREKELGLEVSMYMDRGQPPPMTLQCQLGYLNVVCLPMYETVCEFLGMFREVAGADKVALSLMRQVDENKATIVKIQNLEVNHRPLQALPAQGPTPTTNDDEEDDTTTSVV